MIGYLYVADESGAEIEGSRRYLARCRSREEYQAILRELEACLTSTANFLADPFEYSGDHAVTRRALTSELRDQQTFSVPRRTASI